MSEHAQVHADLGASVRTFAEREGGLRRVRLARDAQAGVDRSLWSQLGGLGWLGLLVSEARGGAGLGLAEMAVVAREFGRALLPEPLAACAVLAANILQHAQGPAGAQLLGALIEGRSVPAVAWQESLGDIDVGRVSARAVAAESRTRISGIKRFVAYGLAADGYLVSARADAGIGLYWVPAISVGLTYESRRRADGTEHGTLTLDRVEIAADQVIVVPGGAEPVLAQALDETIVIQSAELLGVAERVLEMTLEYLRTRTQFGKPIGSFQALQHRCVDLFIRKELGVSALTAVLAAMADAQPSQRAALASRAKSRCADAAQDICRKAIQLHGAIGFTDECDIGLYLKRALTLSAWLGNARMHRRRYAGLSFTCRRPPHVESLQARQGR